MPSEILDDFADVSAWSAVASGLAELRIGAGRGPDGPAMRLDYDFKGGGGFVVARRDLVRSIPDSYAVSFAIRGEAPANRLELKLADPSGRNVWWRHWDAFAPPAAWQTLVVPSREIEFAWGPAGGGALSELGAIELVIAAAPGGGGAGTVWIGDLRLEDRTYRGVPRVSASSEAPGHPAACALDGDARTRWRSAPTAGPHVLDVDFGEEREYGGLVIRWDAAAPPRSCRIEASSDGAGWTTVYADDAGDVERSWVYLPGAGSRFLRIAVEPRTDAGCGIAEVAVEPFEFSRSIHGFFECVAAAAPRGRHPRWLVPEQTYWTPVGLPDGHTCAIMNEEGTVEVDRGTFSIEPFLHVDGRLVTWADAEVGQALEDGWLPIPSSRWRIDGLALETTAFAARAAGRPVLFLRHRVANEGRTVRAVRLFAAVRPFQVNPPWQAFGELGGMRRIATLAWDGRALRVDDRVVVPLVAPSAAGVATFAQGEVTAYLARGEVPPRAAVADGFGYASGALAFDLDVPAGGAGDVFLAVPFGPATADAAGALVATSGEEALARTAADWRVRLGAVELVLPAVAHEHADAVRTAAAQILTNRDGPAIQPGPRRYTRSWIRDGAIMAAALLRMGRSAEACEFARWYATWQRADGNVPSIVDPTGPDWLAEHDSHGELIYLVMECFRFTRDRGFLAELWPAVRRAVDYLETLRATRLGPEYDTPGMRARRGILPESVSHEGYLAHPVHAYWDDFWALQGYRDAAAMAAILGDEVEARRVAAIRDTFHAALRASIARTIEERKIPYVPGSVEWADFDPTATANAVALLGFAGDLPRAPLERTFDQYMEGFRKRRRGEVDWNNYSPYEVRILGALVCLDRRADAAEMAEFFLADRRPPAWNQWPEIAWRDPRSPGHLGDVPHTWIGAEYVLAIRTMLAYERAADGALVLGAGVPASWLDDGEVGVTGLPTHHGLLDFRMRRAGGDVVVSVRLAEMPPGGIVLRPPLARRLASVEVNGQPVTGFDATGVTIATSPADVVLRC